MKIKLFYSIVLSLLFGLGYSQTVTLDATFGNGGKVIYPFTEDGDAIGSTAIQPDGKIIYWGLKEFSLDGNVFLTRFNVNGTIDTDFGINGIVNTSLICEIRGSSFIKLQNDGKILVTSSFATVGNADFFDFATQRYNADGTIDTDFGNNGTVITDFNGKGDFSTAIDLQSDGKIIVAGYSYVNNNLNTRISILRYNSDGVLDTTFANNGKLMVSSFATNSSDYLFTLKVIDDDSILLGANTNALEINEDYWNFGILRINSNGFVDATFGTNGKVITDFGGADYVTAVDEINDEIIVAGYSQISSNSKMVLAKYLNNGDLDTTFGINGIVNSNLTTSTNDIISGMITSADGKLLCSGYTFSSSNADALLIKFNSDGSIDSQFNSVGYITTDFDNNNDLAGSLAIGQDGKIVCSGITSVEGVYQTIFTRHNISELNNQIFSKSKFSIYPNPVSESINIQFQLIQSEDISIDLLDIQGRKISQLMKERNFGNESQNLEVVLPTEISKGIYFVKISNGSEHQTIKIIKE